MPRKKKVITDPSGKDLTQFQGKYADQWRKFIDSDAGQAGLQFLRNKKLNEVSLLTEEMIEKNSREYLANLRGYLQLEDAMAKLPEMTDFTLPFEEVDEYISPEQEVEQDKLRAKFREENQRQRYGH